MDFSKIFLLYSHIFTLPLLSRFFISINRCEKPNQGKWLAVGGEIIFLAPNILWNCSGLPIIIIDNPICIWKGHVKRDFLVHSTVQKWTKRRKNRTWTWFLSSSDCVGGPLYTSVVCTLYVYTLSLCLMKPESGTRGHSQTTSSQNWQFLTLPPLVGFFY